MSARSLLAVAAVALVVAGVVWFVRDGGRGPEAAGADVSRSAAVSPAVGLGMARVCDDPDEPVESARAPLVADAPARVEEPPDRAVGEERGGVRVRVEDLTGAPFAGVPVRMHAWEERPEVVRESGADGRVEFRDDELALRPWGVFVAIAAGVGDVPPPGGTQMNVRRGDEHAFRISGIAYVDAVVRGARDGAWLRSQRGDVGAEVELAGRSRVRLPVIASSGKVRVALEHPGEAFATVRTVEAPDVGGVVEVEFDAEPPPIRLIGRAVDAEGEPLAGRVLAAVLAVEAAEDEPVGPGRRSVSDVRCDATGSFAIGIERAWEGWAATLELADGAPGTIAARLPLARIDDGDNFLGELRLAPPPSIFAGHVVDEQGVPVAGAEVAVYSTQSRFGSDWRARTAEDGAFDVRGLGAEPPLGARVEASGFLERQVQIDAVGQTGARLVLLRAARLAGRVELHDGGAVHEISANIQWLASTPGVFLRGTGRRVDGLGRFAFDDLRAGPARFFVQQWPTHGGNDALLAFDLELVPGENLDPRLDPVRLPPDVVTLELRFVDEDGREPMGLMIDVGARERDGAPARLSLGGGVTIPSPLRGTCRRGTLDVVAGAPGLRWVERRAVTADEVVILPPAPTLALRVEGAEESAVTAWTVVVRYQEPHLAAAFPPIELAQGAANFVVPAAGHYRFELVPREGRGESPAPLVVRLDPDALPAGLVLPVRAPEANDAR